MPDNPLYYPPLWPTFGQMDGAPKIPLASLPNALAQAPTWADAADWHAQNLRDTWAAMQNPQTWTQAAQQYGNALLMGTTAPRMPKMLFHAAGADWQPGMPLSSLYDRFGNEAYEMFSQKWPDAGDLWQYHPHYVMFYKTLKDAASHVDQFGGTVVQVDPSQLEGLRFDNLEKPGYWTARGPIPPEAITVPNATPRR